jgi:tetratricopeptide (TPR) repeat protein
VSYKNEPSFFKHKEKVLFEEKKTTYQQPLKINIPYLESATTTNNKIKVKSLRSDQHLNKEKITQLLNTACWQEVLDIINSNTNDKDKLFLLNSKAIALANMGKLEESALACKDAIALDQINIQAIFTLSMIFLEQNNIDEAEKLLRKTLFLDRKFIMGHFHLGLLLFRNKKYDAGLKCLENALAISSTMHLTDKVNEFQQLTYGDLTNILKHEIEIYLPNRGISRAK